MVDDNKLHPEFTTLAYDDMAKDWPLIRDLMGETRAMQAAGEKWLPPWPKEDEGDYKLRLKATTLFNGLQRSINVLSGKVFTSDIILNEDVPNEISDLTINIDTADTKLAVYAKEWFQDGLELGIAHTFVDSPAIHTDTMAEAKASGARPYWIHVPAENLIFWATDTINGKLQLTEIRIKETLTEPDGEWGEKEVEEIRQFKLEQLEANAEPRMTFVIYRQNEKEEWKVVEEGETDMTVIPLATFYARKTGYLTGKPPLMDLAWINLTHWQSSSEQRHCLSISRRPFLAFFGFEPKDLEGISIGPRSGPATTRTDGHVDMVEASGAGNTAGRQDLLDLKEEMAVLGLELLVRKSTEKTATEASNEKQETESELGGMAQGMEDALNSALMFTGLWMSIENSGTTEVNKDFGLITANREEIQALMQMRAAREIPRLDFWEAMRVRGVLPEDFDPDAAAAALDAEGDF